MTLVRPGSFMDNIGTSSFPVKGNRVRGFVAGDAKVPFIACADIGHLVAAAFERPNEFTGQEINAVGDFVSGDEIAAILGKLRGGRRVRYQVVPALVMRLFAPEFYAMRRAFEKNGRPPYPPEISGYLAETRRLCPATTTMEMFLATWMPPATASL